MRTQITRVLCFPPFFVLSLLFSLLLVLLGFNLLLLFLLWRISGLTLPNVSYISKSIARG